MGVQEAQPNRCTSVTRLAPDSCPLRTRHQNLILGGPDSWKIEPTHLADRSCSSCLKVHEAVVAGP